MSMALRSPAPRTERETLTALSFCWADLLFRLDSQFVITYATGAFDVIVGTAATELIGTMFADLFAKGDFPAVAQFIKTIKKRGRAEGEGLRLMHRGRLPIMVRCAGYCWRDEYFIGLRLLSTDQTVMPLNFKRDDTTGLLEPEAFAALASRRIKDSDGRGKDMALTVLAMPELYNLCDRLTDQKAADLLQELGTRLRVNSLGRDTVSEIDKGRYGLVHDVGMDVANLKDELKDLSKTYDPQGPDLAITNASITLDGVESVSQDHLAKGLMYFVHQLQKTKGKDFKLNDIAENISDLCNKGLKQIQELRQTILSSDFGVVFQPIVDCHTGRIQHYESLCRFGAPGSMESPFHYITFAEEVGLIHEFDLAMTKRVLGWAETKPRHSDRYHVAINISGYSVGVESFLQSLDSIMSANKWAKGKVMFEITESSKMSDLTGANTFIQHMRGMGYKMCLDDFGAGAASKPYARPSGEINIL